MKNIKLYVIDNGKNWIDRSILVAGWDNATASNKNPSAQWVGIPIMVFLIDHPDGLILFDTGCNPKSMTERWPEHMREMSPYEVNEESLLVNRLAQLKIQPKDINYVVVSHLHNDHGGNLEIFKNAEIFVSDNELTKTLRQYVLNDDLNCHIPRDIEQWIKAGLRWRPVMEEEKELKLMEGVTILNFGSGHAWGNLGLLIELQKTGNILFSGDAIYTKENMGPPIKQPGIIYDSLGYVATINKIMKILDEKNAQIWFGHDIKQFEGFIKSTEGYYE